jgi:hypothetical protein
MDQASLTLSPPSTALRKLILTVISNHTVHPMKPTRIRMTHSLVMNYGLYKKMEIFVRHMHKGINVDWTADSSTSWLYGPIAGETSYETGDVSVPYGRICRLSVQDQP